MANYTRKNKNVTPYWDDFVAHRNLVRILFNVKRPVQVREMIQLQTILQNQISSFANHVFEDGSSVTGGEVSVSTEGQWIEIALTDTMLHNGGAAPTTQISNVQDLVGQHIQKWTSDSTSPSGTLALVDAVDNNSGTLRLQLTYRGGSFEVGDKFVTTEYAEGDDLLTKYESDGSHVSGVGNSIRAKVKPGIIYMNGLFLVIPVEQEIFVNKADTSGNWVIGYEVTEITLAYDDTTHLDPIDGSTILGETLNSPAAGSNSGAPGGERWMVIPELKAYETGTQPDNFHQIIKLSSGNVEERVKKPQYSEILDLIAERTYDESGSYVVHPFNCRAKVVDEDNFNYEISSGKAYVFGRAFEKVSPTLLPVSKAKTDGTSGTIDHIRNISGETVPRTFGTFVVRERAENSHVFDGATDVDDTEDTITVTAHGFETGDGVLYEDGGGTVIPGLTDGGTYYIIQIDANTISLASNRDNAINKVAIDLTGTGVGASHVLARRISENGFPDPTAFDLWHLMTGANGTGASLGTVRVWYINDVGGDTRIFLGDNNDLRDLLPNCYSLAADNAGSPDASDGYINLEAWNANQASANSAPIIPLTPPVKEVTSLDYTTLIKISVAVTNGSAYTLNTGSANDTLESDVLDSVVSVIRQSTGAPQEISTSVLGTFDPGGGQSAQSTGNNLATATYDFYVRINRASAIPRVKVLTRSVITVTPGSSVNSFKLSADSIYDVSAIEEVLRDPGGDDEDVTANIGFLDGQKDFYYDYGSIYTKDQTNFTADDYQVTVHHWVHQGTGDYFAADSYTKGVDTYYDEFEGAYGNIPVYKARNKTYRLRDHIDFRRNITEITSAREVMEPNSSLVIDYDYYLPRYDRIWIDAKGKIGVTLGIPEENPRIPPPARNTMTLFTALVTAFTFERTGQGPAIDYLETVHFTKLDNKNFTMQDIHKLEKRIRHLEYYTAENQLETGAYGDDVLDADGFTKQKNGIFVDKFTSHAKGRTDELSYRCSMDYEIGKLRCPYEMNMVQFEYDPTPADSGTQTNISNNDHTITMDFSEVVWVEQPVATGCTNINPFAVLLWAGSLNLNPSSDFWIETQYAPDIIVDDPAERARILALYTRDDVGIPRWNAWESTVLGVVQFEQLFHDPELTGVDGLVLGLFERTTTQDSRTGTIVEQSGWDTVTEQIGDRVIDRSEIYFQRMIDVNFVATGMRPNTQVSAFFGDVNVTANITEWRDSDGSATGTPGSPATTDLRGYIAGTFRIPEQTFRTGSNILTLKDTNTPPQTIASSEFFSDGVLVTRAREIVSVEVPTYTVRDIAQSAITSSTELIEWYDPIAQSFLVEDEGGVFLNSIDVYFCTKDRYVPVMLHIVETIAGLPGHRIVPFSQVTVDAYDVQATTWNENAGEFQYANDHYDSDDVLIAGKEIGDTVAGGPTDFAPTKFTFSDPVYLREGAEYAFVLLSNSNNYEVYRSTMGEFEIVSGAAVSKQPHLGSMFKSQNASTWTPDQYSDIKFKLNRCDFVNSASTLFMRTKGQNPAWDSSETYVAGDTVIFNPSGGFLTYVATASTSAGESPNTHPAKWSFVGPGEYDATMFNISMDNMVLPGTRLETNYIIGETAPSGGWIPFTNKQSSELLSKETVELYTDDGILTEPNVFNLKLDLFTDSSWHSPVINKNRSSAVLINNLVRTPDSDAPAGFTWDAGEYISRTTNLKTAADDLKVLMDVRKPGDADVRVKYRAPRDELRYVAVEDLAAYQNSGPKYSSLKDEICVVYSFDDALAGDGSNIGSWTQLGQVVVDGFDNESSPKKIYLSSISNIEDFAALAGNERILITTEPDIDVSEINDWVGSEATTYDIGYYVIYNYALWQSNVDDNSTIPSDNGTDWTRIESVLVEGEVQVDTDNEWRPMELQTVVSDDLDTSKYIEYEWRPAVTPSEEFSTFAIKVEMYSKNEVNVPECRRLRVIAVS